ncbi:hypothetical protein K432DRAFT_441126 [Lepidopterella palustris CBS 459.81]|uniref:Uncharacterized protein n=1 Tax=Lepidopterella palustris CBS 459.81 TaxID=1314670 RepID=A0A8E2JID3_9PEZI|nr:hypothetical protein K432DRAFT_441126 [Lepidopterella palustris CBS 459.81]
MLVSTMRDVGWLERGRWEWEGDELRRPYGGIFRASKFISRRDGDTIFMKSQTAGETNIFESRGAGRLQDWNQGAARRLSVVEVWLVRCVRELWIQSGINGFSAKTQDKLGPQGLSQRRSLGKPKGLSRLGGPAIRKRVLLKTNVIVECDDRAEHGIAEVALV